jgi:hypothetical protein
MSSRLYDVIGEKYIVSSVTSAEASGVKSTVTKSKHDAIAMRLPMVILMLEPYMILTSEKSSALKGKRDKIFTQLHTNTGVT